MKIGVFKTSKKENEKRLPIHPLDIKKIPSYLLSQFYFEKNYGSDFGVSDKDLDFLGCQLLTREELFQKCDLLILPKPVVSDLEEMREGQTLCGWSHAVQQRDITRIAIDKKLTLIAWEEMNQMQGGEKVHIFYKNNELAGYAGVLHYLQLCGQDGFYGKSKQVVVLGFGSVSRGAIYALQNRGYKNIIVYTKRQANAIKDKILGITYKCIYEDNLFQDLKTADIIFNGVLQDVLNPQMFISTESEFAQLKDGVGIIDISCDEGMGFYFAKPTTFIEPVIYLSRGIKYYSVDHTPTYLWDAATHEISNALLPYLSVIINPDMWDKSNVIKWAIDIYKGEILNKKIKKFQNL